MSPVFLLVVDPLEEVVMLTLLGRLGSPITSTVCLAGPTAINGLYKEWNRGQTYQRRAW